MSKNKPIVMTNALDLKLEELDAISQLIRLKLEVLQKNAPYLSGDSVEEIIKSLIALNAKFESEEDHD